MLQAACRLKPILSTYIDCQLQLFWRVGLDLRMNIFHDNVGLPAVKEMPLIFAKHPFFGEFDPGSG